MNSGEDCITAELAAEILKLPPMSAGKASLVARAQAECKQTDGARKQITMPSPWPKLLLGPASLPTQARRSRADSLKFFSVCYPRTWKRSRCAGTA